MWPSELASFPRRPLWSSLEPYLFLSVLLGSSWKLGLVSRISRMLSGLPSPMGLVLMTPLSLPLELCLFSTGQSLGLGLTMPLASSLRLCLVLMTLGHSALRLCLVLMTLSHSASGPWFL